jgi:hypothetical protein
VFDDSFADTESQIETTVSGVTLLEVLNDAKSVKIVIETTSMTAKATIQSPLPCVAEGRMADVVDKRKGFGEVFIQTERAGCHAGDLGDLDGVSKAAAKVVGCPAGEDLRLPREAAKGASLDDALPIALKGCTRGAEGRGEDTGYKRIVRVSSNRAPMKIDGHSQL